MYLGLKEIKNIVEENTASAGDIVHVVFVDGTAEILRKKLYDASVSPEPLDPTALRDLQMRPIAGDILLVLYEWDIRWSDYDFVDALVRNSLQEHMKMADAKLWGKHKQDVTIRDIDKVKHQ